LEKRESHLELSENLHGVEIDDQESVETENQQSVETEN